jgi:probable phosphomutase (TIGR03848 family)
MATVILVRHGRSTANSAGVLAGRMSGVRLDPTGLAQARSAADRLAPLPLAAIVTSPIQRCRQTARAISDAQGAPPPWREEKRLTECDYGEWQGRTLKDLAGEPLWRTVQTQPSAATFPGGESLATMQARAVAAIREQDAAVAAEAGENAVWVAVSHGDPIKAVLADALGMHLDLFQRLHVDPASISVIRYTDARPFVLATNTHAGDLSWLVPPVDAPTDRDNDAAVGGGAGPGEAA